MIAGRCAPLCRSECPPLEPGLSQLVAGLEAAWQCIACTEAIAALWTIALGRASLKRDAHMMSTAGWAQTNAAAASMHVQPSGAVFGRRHGTAVAVRGRTTVCGRSSWLQSSGVGSATVQEDALRLP